MSTNRLDIFRQLPDGTPLWVETIDNLEAAQKRLDELAAIRPGPYAVYDVRDATYILPFCLKGPA